MAMCLRGGGRQREREREARDRAVVAAVDRIASGVHRVRPVPRYVAFADERQIDAPSLHDEPEGPADHPEPHPRATPRRGRVAALDGWKVVPRHDRPGAVAVDRVADRHRPLRETADHPATSRDDYLPGAVLD